MPIDYEFLNIELALKVQQTIEFIESISNNDKLKAMAIGIMVSAKIRKIVELRMPELLPLIDELMTYEE